MSEPPVDVTGLLGAVADGDRAAPPKLFSAVYSELHALARAAMQNERPGRTLQTTALVHEAYLRLVREVNMDWRTRAHFFGTAASAMRRILVDEARRRRAAKRGSGRAAVRVEASQLPDRRGGLHADDLEALDRALDQLAEHSVHERKGRIVELRFFVGLTLDQTADVLGISAATVKRDWEFARAWLRRAMDGESIDASTGEG